MNVLANQKTFYLNCHSLKIKSGYRTFMSDSWLILIALREKCPNTDQKKPVFGHFSRSVGLSFIVLRILTPLELQQL